MAKKIDADSPKTREYQLLTGFHKEGDRIFVANKDTVEPVIVSSPHDLTAMFGADKFRRIGDVAQAATKATKGDPQGNPNGDLATGEFEGAADLGLEIFEKGGWFKVFKGSELLGGKALRQEGVEDLVENMIAASK